MIRYTHRRAGVTLMEVLIATGILAIGMLAILALFPIGAVSMARAINQSRAADHGANSDAMLRYYWKRAWLDPNTGGVRPEIEAAAFEPTLISYLDRMPGDPLPPLPGRIPPNSSQPSYPVFIDPIGVRTQSGAFALAVAGQTGVLPTRVSLQAALNDPLPRSTIRLTTLLDDFTFDGNGEPTARSGQLERGGRYNAAWLIQRPRNNVPHEVYVHVLVYGGRSPTDTPSEEIAYVAVTSGYFDGVDPKPNLVSVNYGAQVKPPVKKGSWVAFAVALQPPGGMMIPGFDFYRVSAVTDVTPGVMALEFEQPLRTYATGTFVGGTYTPGTGDLLGAVVFFDNLLEVFDRGIMSATGITGR